MERLNGTNNNTKIDYFSNWYFPMKKLIPLFLSFACITSVSAQTSIPFSPTDTKQMIIDVRSTDYVPRYSECHSGTDIVQSISDIYYEHNSKQLTEWATYIQQTRPLRLEELNQFTEVKMILLSEYSTPSNRTFSLCDEIIDTFNTKK